MFQMTTAEIVREVEGKLTAGSAENRVVAVAIDSRKAGPHYLFIAFPGQKVDGHDFLLQAAQQGATAVLVNREMDVPLNPAVAVIQVTNPLIAVQRLAQYQRKLFQGPVVAVTGSNGKTTTKEMLRQVFAERGEVLATPENQNNELGLPLTLLGLEPNHKTVVVEMGMRARGEIRDLCRIASPTTGVITNVGHSHMEILGSQEQIALAKTELLETLPAGGFAVLNGDDPWLRKLSYLAACPTLWFGFTRQCDAFAENVRTDGQWTVFTARVLGDSCEVRLPQFGRHNVANALAALLAGVANGLDLQHVVPSLERFTSGTGRLHQVPGRRQVLIIDDCYNASPSSMKASLEVLTTLGTQRPTVAILGDMYELGSYEAAGHREVGEFAVTMGVNKVIAVGHLAEGIALGAEEARRTQRDSNWNDGLSQRTSHCDVRREEVEVCYFPDKAALLQQLDNIIPAGAVVLVKASRAMALEEVVAALADQS